MTSPPQRVQVFSLGLPKTGTPREQRRYRVKWRVNGRDRTRSFPTRAEADRVRSSLLAAVHDGLLFDEPTGLPAAWVTPVGLPTWWGWTREWLELKWPQWSGNSRRTAVETLTLLAVHLVRSTAPATPPELARWLREVGYQPGALPADEWSDWMDRWSLPLADIDGRVLERVLTAVTRKADGTMTAPSVTRRRRNMLMTILRSALRRGLIRTNPMETVEWRTPKANLTIDVSTVPSPADVSAVIDHVTALPSQGRRYAALFALIGMAGMRPSEAAGLLVRDVDLPEAGWGMAILRGALTAPGARYTASGSVAESKGLKHRPEGSIREVPLAPELVSRLRLHLEKFEPVEGRVLSTGTGHPIAAANYGQVWIRARARLWPPGHPLARATVYDLRHAAATTMLLAGLPPAEVARRLGHSVDVLMRVYAGVFNDERERSNQLLDDFLAERRNASTSG